MLMKLIVLLWCFGFTIFEIKMLLKSKDGDDNRIYHIFGLIVQVSVGTYWFINILNS